MVKRPDNSFIGEEALCHVERHCRCFLQIRHHRLPASVAAYCQSAAAMRFDNRSSNWLHQLYELDQAVTSACNEPTVARSWLLVEMETNNRLRMGLN